LLRVPESLRGNQRPAVCQRNTNSNSDNHLALHSAFVPLGLPRPHRPPMRPHRPYINIFLLVRGVTGNQIYVFRCNDMKNFIVVLAMIFAIALLAQAGVFFRFGLPISIPVPASTGRRITRAVITMALTVMHITRDPTGAIDIGLTDTGATIEKVPSGSPIRPFNCSFENEIVSQASPLSLA
jgi:hypothetical protein